MLDGFKFSKLFLSTLVFTYINCMWHIPQYCNFKIGGHKIKQLPRASLDLCTPPCLVPSGKILLTPMNAV